MQSNIKRLCKFKNLSQLSGKELTEAYKSIAEKTQYSKSARADLVKLEKAVTTSSLFVPVYVFGSKVGVVRDGKYVYDERVKLYEGKRIVVDSQNNIMVCLYTGGLIKRKFKNMYFEFLADDGNMYREAVFIRFEKIENRANVKNIAKDGRWS